MSQDGERVRAWTVACDGLCEPNPGGVATYGWQVTEGTRTLGESCALVGVGHGVTNNIADYTALIEVLRWLLQADRPDQLHVTIRMDSQLVVKQMDGEWAVKAPAIFPLYLQACDLWRALRKECHTRLEWIPRQQNAVAEALSRKAYEEHLGAQVNSRQKRSDGLPISDNGDGTFMVGSASRSGLEYQVDPRVPLCTCPDFQRRRQPCKHIFAVKAALQGLEEGVV